MRHGPSTRRSKHRGGVAQQVRALPCHGRGRGFESRRSRIPRLSAANELFWEAGQAEAIRHAIDHALATEDAGEDPDRWLVIGPERAGNLLEVVVLVTIEGAQVAIHAMRMRAKFRRLIEP
jgi:hypothetical protein